MRYLTIRIRPAHAHELHQRQAENDAPEYRPEGRIVELAHDDRRDADPRDRRWQGTADVIPARVLLEDRDRADVSGDEQGKNDTRRIARAEDRSKEDDGGQSESGE